jgi:hypothetical protein
MATFQAVFVPTSPIANATTFTGTIGAGGTVSVTIGYRTIFAVSVAADSNIKFGNAAKAPTAAATDFPIWSKSIQEWETGEEMDRVSLFSTAGGTYWIYCLSSK